MMGNINFLPIDLSVQDFQLVNCVITVNSIVTNYIIKSLLQLLQGDRLSTPLLKC